MAVTVVNNGDGARGKKVSNGNTVRSGPGKMIRPEISLPDLDFLRLPFRVSIEAD